MDSLKFGSFPRSGSHFFVHLTGCEWLSHRIAPLATSKNVVTSVRDPLECVPSWIVLTDDTRPARAEKVLEWYCAYYIECVRLNILVLPFARLVADPLGCVGFVASRLGVNITANTGYDLTSGFHKPTPDKSQFADILLEVKKAPNYGLAIELFTQLSNERDEA